MEKPGDGMERASRSTMQTMKKTMETHQRSEASCLCKWTCVKSVQFLDRALVWLLTPMYDSSDPDPSPFLSVSCTPSDLSSYTLVDRIEMMTGSADIYIKAVYSTNRAGATSLMLMMYKPLWRTVIAWYSPQMIRFPVDMLVMEGKSIWSIIQKTQTERYIAVWMAARYQVFVDGNRRMKQRRG